MTRDRSILDAPAALFADVVERLANAVLPLDPDASDRLAPLNGRALRLAPDGLPPVTIRVDDGKLNVIPEDPEPASVVAEGPPLELLRLLAGRQSNAIHITGDPSVLADFSALIGQFSPDVNFASGISDLGERAAVYAEAGLAAFRAMAENALRSTREHLGERFPDKDATERFEEKIDELQRHLAQLAERIDAFTHRSSENPRPTDREKRDDDAR